MGERFDRFAVRVVALRVAPPDLLSIAALDLLRERSELVAVLALIRRGLLVERVWPSATLIWSVGFEGTARGLCAPRRSDILPGFVGALDLKRLDLRPEPSVVAGALLARFGVPRAWEGWGRLAAPVLRLFAAAELWDAPPGVFDAGRLAAALLRVDASAPFDRSPLACR